MARDVMTQLIARGRVVRGWLGVVIQDLTPELAAGFGVKEDAGVLVAEVMKDSPAGAAGLKPGDVITDFDGGADQGRHRSPEARGRGGARAGRADDGARATASRSRSA